MYRDCFCRKYSSTFFSVSHHNSKPPLLSGEFPFLRSFVQAYICQFINSFVRQTYSIVLRGVHNVGREILERNIRSDIEERFGNEAGAGTIDFIRLCIPIFSFDGLHLFWFSRVVGFLIDKRRLYVSDGYCLLSSWMDTRLKLMRRRWSLWEI